MSESTKPTSNEAENVNKSKPMLANRIMEFRAFHKSKKKMYKVFSFCDEFVKVVTDVDLVEKFRKEEFVPLMQNTGIKYIDETYIFEGDIIKIPDDYDTCGMNAGEDYIIYFAYGGFRCIPKYNKNAKGTWLEDNGEFEKIGNIFENPEFIPETSF